MSTKPRSRKSAAPRNRQAGTRGAPDWRRWREHDPARLDEARRYDHPIPSRRLLRSYFEARAVPASLAAVAASFDLADAEREALAMRLGAMCRDGDLIENRRGEFCLTRRLPVKTGTVLAHRDGFGFLAPDGGGDDVFLPPRTMRTLMHGDRAAVRVQRGRDGREEGRLVDVLERGRSSLSGEYFQEHGVGFVRPDDRRLRDDVLIPGDARGAARPGEMVTVELTDFPGAHGPAVGRVIEILGAREAAGMASELAIRNHQLPHEWPAAVAAEASALPDALRAADLRERRDLRELPLVTIDGEDARDFDDALYCRRDGDGFRLHVAIADVSHYVRAASALDCEAEGRGNSVYFPDRVLPMLPEALSNGLCSLNPEVDRLCMVAELSVRRDGEVARSHFYPALMHSRARLTYTEVAAILVDGDKAARRKRKTILGELDNLYAVYRALAAARKRRGAIDFDTVETRFVFDAAGAVTDLVPVVRNDAHRIVEECMIAANSAVARRLRRAKVPALYRVHEHPAADKLAELRDFLALHGLSLGGGDRPEPQHYAKLVKAIAERPDRLRIQTMLLRSLAQAIYAPEPGGHFGLALADYTHFTSPIRRYPDLVVHRALKRTISVSESGQSSGGGDKLEALGRHCSMTERRADEATREAADMLKCQFMRERVGEVFAGVVSGVTGFGLFVELEGLYLEGLVHVTALPSDYWEFDPGSQRLRGSRSGASYAIGDHLRVKVARVSVEERKIDLVPAEATSPRRRTQAKAAGARARKRG
ncbi:MAG TPA: ribonuclease R [Gammaproteobacteria bacterium]|nr:ribonuclease R [Gammaproteobacteria bacterium]